jgi:hypothetical protein
MINGLSFSGIKASIFDWLKHPILQSANENQLFRKLKQIIDSQDPHESRWETQTTNHLYYSGQRRMYATTRRQRLRLFRPTHA